MKINTYSIRSRILASTGLLSLLLLSALVFLTPARAAGDQLPGDHRRSIDFQKRILGMQRPDFVLPDINNQQRSAREWNNKLLLVNFWATWCTPCRKEIPIFNRLQAEYGNKGVQFIGIAIDNAKSVKKFIQDIPLEYPNLIGGAGAVRLAVTYGNVKGILPFTALVDKGGRIQSIMSGKLTEKRIRELLEKYLDDAQ